MSDTAREIAQKIVRESETTAQRFSLARTIERALTTYGNARHKEGQEEMQERCLVPIREASEGVAEAQIGASETRTIINNCQMKTLAIVYRAIAALPVEDSKP